MVETIHIGERERHFYELCAYVVMENHVHLLIRPFQPVPLIMRWLKGSTARKANQLLERTGKAFWQDESYDHWVRSHKELAKIVKYIEWNPMAAGLVHSAEEWPWSSAYSGQM
jgi:REP element-mobilizing transposase RayT